MSRDAARARLLAAAGWADAACAWLPGDASFRRYARLNRADGGTAMLMDSPPNREPLRPFLDVAGRLARLGFTAPAVLAADEAAGFALLEDFGDETYARALGAGADGDALYDGAVDLLIGLRRACMADPDAMAGLPAYDAEKLQAEAALFLDWWAPAHGREPTAADRAQFTALIAAIAARAAPAPVLVLRDFHVENLMVAPGRTGRDGIALLDFQDAVAGPPAYDLVSLVDDARHDVPDALADRLMARYAAAYPDDDPALAAGLSAQRSLKILGIFVRLAKRDGKPRYLAHLPRVWRMLERRLAHPDLTELRALIHELAPDSCRERAA